MFVKSTGNSLNNIAIIYKLEPFITITDDIG